MRRVALLMFVLGLTVAGCGSGGKSPSVASLGTTGTTTTSSQSTPPPAGGALSSSGRGGGGFQLQMRGGLKFSQCMRAHGVPGFPDPNGQGRITLNSSSGVDPRSPVFRTAQQACRKELPNGGRPNPQQLAKAKQSALAFSACMRAHGVKNFPDPTFSGGGIQMSLNGRGMTPDNPTFKKAQTACQGDLSKR